MGPLRDSCVGDRRLGSLCVSPLKARLGLPAGLSSGKSKGAEDNMRVVESFSPDEALYGRFFMVRLGKKKHHLYELVA